MSSSKKKDHSIISKEIMSVIMDNNYPRKIISDKQMKVIEDFSNKYFPKGTTKEKYKNSLIIKNDREKIKINHNFRSPYVALPGTQQSTKKILKELEWPIDKSLTIKENFISYIKTYGLNEYVNYIFSYITSIDNLVVFDAEIKSYQIYEMAKFNFDYGDIKSNIIEDQNLSTWWISINGIKIITLQVPASKSRPNSHIMRFDKRLWQHFYKEIVKNNETWGISVEVAICQLYGIPIPSEYKGRYDQNYVLEAQGVISNNIDEFNIPTITKCLATNRVGQKKSPADFKAGEQTISVKTNFNSNWRVCPPAIGQPGMDVGLKFYNSIFDVEIFKSDMIGKKLKFKEEFQKHIHKILEAQLDHLFSEDYILYLRKDKKKTKLSFIGKKEGYNFEPSKISFTRNPNEWNESVTIKYKDESIAEMQLHSNRSPFKFRFHFKNLMEMLEKNDG